MKKLIWLPIIALLSLCFSCQCNTQNDYHLKQRDSLNTIFMHYSDEVQRLADSSQAHLNNGSLDKAIYFNNLANDAFNKQTNVYHQLLALKR